MGWFKRAVKRNKKWAKNKKKKLKKLKLKDVISNDLVQAGLSFVPGGNLLNKAIDRVESLQDIGDKIKSSLPKELQSLKAKDLLASNPESSIDEAIDNELFKESNLVLAPASTTRGQTIRITTKSSSFSSPNNSLNAGKISPPSTTKKGVKS